MQTEISRFDLVNQVSIAARSSPDNSWEQMRESRLSQAQAEMDRIESRLSRKRRDFSKPNSGEPARAEAAQAQTTPVIKTGKPGRPRKTLYAWGDSPKH